MNDEMQWRPMNRSPSPKQGIGATVRRCDGMTIKTAKRQDLSLHYRKPSPPTSPPPDSHRDGGSVGQRRLRLTKYDYKSTLSTHILEYRQDSSWQL